MGIPEEEQCFFDRWDEDKLEEILCTQRVVVKDQKVEIASKRLYGIAVIVDDFADSPQVMASRAEGNALNTLPVRGRQMCKGEHGFFQNSVANTIGKTRSMGNKTAANKGCG